MIPITKINQPMTQQFNQKTRQPYRLPPNTIYFDHKSQIEIDPIEGARWIGIGDAGSGKSFFDGILLSQFKNVLFFDPTKKFIQTIIKQSKHIENQLGQKEEAKKYIKKWKEWVLTPTQNTPNAFKMNVKDLHVRCLDSIFWRMEDSEKAIHRRQVLEQFLMQPKKNYAEWKQLCEENRGLTTVFNDLNWILSHDDSAPEIEQIVHGAHIIDISEISTNNCCVGVFMQALMAHRKNLPDSYVLSPEHFVMIALDEAQEWCTNNSPVGIAFADINNQGRKYGLGEKLTSSAYNKLHIDVRTKSTMHFVFRSKGMTNKYRSSNLDILPEEWDNLPQYGCFIFSGDGKFNGAINGDTCLPSFHYLNLKAKSQLTEYTIKPKTFSFNYKPFFI